MLNINMKFMTFGDVREFLLSNNLEDYISSTDSNLFLSSDVKELNEDNSSTFLIVDTDPNEGQYSIYDNIIICVVNNPKGIVNYTSFLLSLISLNSIFPITDSEGNKEEVMITYDLEEFIENYKDEVLNDGQKVLQCADEEVLRDFIQERLDLYKSRD